jgi:hypothetical protein
MTHSITNTAQQAETLLWMQEQRTVSIQTATDILWLEEQKKDNKTHTET